MDRDIGAKSNPETGPKPTTAQRLLIRRNRCRYGDQRSVIGVSRPAGEPTEHVEHQRWWPGTARSRPVPDRAVQRMEHRGGVWSSLQPKRGDVQKTVPNSHTHVTWVPDRGGNLMGIEAVVPGSGIDSLTR